MGKRKECKHQWVKRSASQRFCVLCKRNEHLDWFGCWN